MTRILSTCLAIVMAASSAWGAEADAILRPAADAEIADFRWHKRPVVVFADSDEDPRFIEQVEYLREGLELLNERDVVVLTDTDPDARLPLRMKLRPRGFMLAIVAKDGTVMLRKPLPWTVREITRSIDKMPDRQREIEERRGQG